jgi:hypothetical protein
MGNLVTNTLTLSGPEFELKRLIGLLTEMDPDLLLGAARARPDRTVWADLAPWRAVPEPDVISETGDGHLADIGLAVLSRGGTDHLRLKRERDPFLSLMPPEYGETAEGLLRKLGLDRLAGEALLQAAEAKAPGCLIAGRRAIAAYEATGEFGWYDWRRRHWGARAFGSELRLEAGTDGSVTLRFDSVNDCPVPLLMALLTKAADLEMNGAALDEDAGEAVFFATDGTELLVTGSDEEAELARAYRVIYGRDPVTDEDPEP